MNRQPGVVEQVRSLLTQFGIDSTICEVAKHLGMTSRTLSRHLEQECSAFRQLKDEARIARSQQLLHHTRMPIEQIAEATGFRSVRRFREFFVRHTGQTPSVYRQTRS